jgi:hypothetical protein
MSPRLVRLGLDGEADAVTAVDDVLGEQVDALPVPVEGGPDVLGGVGLGALRGAGTALGIAAAGVVNVLDVGSVVLGGSFAALAPWLAGHVEGEVNARALTAQWSPVAVRASALGPAAAVIGAAGSVVREIRASPAVWIDTSR